MAARINIVDNVDKIREYLLYKSDSMSNYITKNQHDDFLLLVKPVTLISTGIDSIELIVCSSP